MEKDRREILAGPVVAAGDSVLPGGRENVHIGGDRLYGDRLYGAVCAGGMRDYVGCRGSRAVEPAINRLARGGGIYAVPYSAGLRPGKGNAKFPLRWRWPGRDCVRIME